MDSAQRLPTLPHTPLHSTSCSTRAALRLSRSLHSRLHSRVHHTGLRCTASHPRWPSRSHSLLSADQQQLPQQQCTLVRYRVIGRGRARWPSGQMSGRHGRERGVVEPRPLGVGPAARGTAVPRDAPLAHYLQLFTNLLHSTPLHSTPPWQHQYRSRQSRYGTQ